MEPSNTKLSSTWSHIKDLHPTKMKLISAIKVRLVRIYELETPENNREIASLECIFHDSEGDRVHATIPRMKYKITTGMYKIKFTVETDVKRMIDEDFPNQIFLFKAFEEIEALDVIKDGELFDVIGVLLNKPMPQIITCQNGAQRKLIELVLQDIKGKRLTCTPWEKYVDDFRELLEQNNQPSNIIIIHMCRPNMFQGKMKVQSAFRVTKVLVNASIPEVDEFNERIVIAIDFSTTTVIGSADSILSSEKSDTNVELKTIEELFLANEGTICWIYGRVVNIDKLHNWFYISCKSCAKKLTKQGQQFYCKKCNKLDTSVNMRLVLDVMDETGGVSLVLWERECLKIIGRTVADVLKHEGEMLPDSIQNAFIQRKFLFKISLKSKGDNECNGSYSVMQVSTDLTLISAYNRNITDSEESYCVTKVQENKTFGNIEEGVALMKTPSSKLEVASEWLDDGKVKRSLDDEFSSTMPQKKSKVFVKVEE